MYRKEDHAGFTLLELLVAVLILSFVMIGISTVYVSNRTAFDRGQTQAEVHQNARVGLQTGVREIRMAGYDPLSQIALQGTPVAVQVADTDIVTFLADVNRDDTLDQVTYKLQGTQLIREFSSWNGAAFPAPVAGQLADGLSQLTFTYFDGNEPTNNLIAAPVAAGSLDDIRRITITLTTDGQTVQGSQETFPVIVDVRLRNLM